MKRWLSFAVVLALLATGLVLSQSQARKIHAPVEPTALLYLVADTERELTRLPMKYTRMPDDEEIKIGNQIAAEIEDSTQDDEAKVVEAYLRTVGNRIAAKAQRKLPYKFHYIPDRNFINAFALPGGHVFMGAGLLSLMENEDELAAVLGHEIEHIDHYHCAERLQTEAALRHIPLSKLVYIPIVAFQAGYSKDQELEADNEGTRLAVASGYSPEGAIQVFAQFQKMEEEFSDEDKPRTPQEEVSGAAVQILTGYFRSHPPSADRVAQIQALIAQEKWPLLKERPLAVRYIFLAHQAEDLVAANKYDKAIAAASTALQLHPGHTPALVALAKASCATHDFAKAAAAYKELIDKHRAEADSVRAFADDQGTAAMAAKHFAEAGQFASFSLELQPNNPNALKLLAEVKLEQEDNDTALQIGRKLQALYPDAASQLGDYINSATNQAFDSRNYQRAVRFARFDLELRPAPQLDIRSVLARSEFALADFPAAAESYRKIIELRHADETAIEPALFQAYADALGSTASHADAARGFQTAMRHGLDSGPDFAAQVKIEEAGLEVMNGNDALARSLTDGQIAFAPERGSRLGWWYYRAGKYEAADNVLRRLQSQRPGDAGLRTTLGWVELERNAPEDALSGFEAYVSEQPSIVAARAGQAIAQWRLHEADKAMAEFDYVSKAAPEWTNPTWVRAIYGPAAAQGIQEMYAEQQRRIAAHKR